mmetsp:Transcript_3270/g.4273  ORF Transcript_3270/g.4273 Transcript_3270/m.4273 type:complete len:163 (-) Transcript_3270:33-521(-)
MDVLYGSRDIEYKEKGREKKKERKEEILAIIESLISHKYGYVFEAPVSADEAEDYDEVVKFRVDLSGIREKVLKGQIETILDFYWHILLMFQNAFMYNAPGSDIVVLTNNIKRAAVKEIEQVLAADGVNIGSLFSTTSSSLAAPSPLMSPLPKPKTARGRKD